MEATVDTELDTELTEPQLPPMTATEPDTEVLPEATEE